MRPSLETKAKEILSKLKNPATIDPVANDVAKEHNISLLVEAMRWAQVHIDVS